MRTMTNRHRRRFLKLLAASPLIPYLDLPSLLAAQSGAAPATSDLIAAVGDALNVFDFEAVARAKLPAWHWAWMANGGEDGGTIRATREGFDHYQIRARRLVDVSTRKRKRGAEVAIIEPPSFSRVHVNQFGPAKPGHQTQTFMALHPS